jgi:pSer/pThr/pTyr-binding forkhead associated (FHA) protein
MKDVTFWLQLLDEDERFPLIGNITIGRHLDNDLVVAGEDVRDYHARLELTPRGPRIFPLEDANLLVDDVAVEHFRDLMPGDTLVMGQHQLTLISEQSEQSIHWALHAPKASEGHQLSGTLLTIGRGDSCDLQILEGHVSRQHARLEAIGDTVWLKDLESSNGSYVNGERLVGAVRVFHGDELTFDISRYQLIGDHPELTPIRPVTAVAEAFEFDPELIGEPPPSATQTPLAVAPAPRIVPAEISAQSETPADDHGPYLLGIGGGVAERRYPLTLGQHLVGRAPDVEIHLPEPSVSLRHAEIDVRADGVFVTNLISTNGVQVNGKDVSIQRLEPGDQLQLGRALLEYRRPELTTDGPGPGTSNRTLALAIAIALLAGTIMWWGFGGL